MCFGYKIVAVRFVAVSLAIASLLGCAGTTVSGGGVITTPTLPALQHILFVGDSYTHGRYSPVRNYGSSTSLAAGFTDRSTVVDENYGQTGSRAESTNEPGPYGGVPGIFAQFAVETSLNYDVHIEAISSTSLGKNYIAASSVIAQSQWSAVVLQEISTRPLTVALSGDSSSNPSNFCGSVQTIEAAVHAADTSSNATAAKIYLYETWARGDEAAALSGATTSSNFATNYAANLTAIGNFYHNVYNRAAVVDGKITGVAPVGEAWARASAESVANLNPYTGTSSLPLLYYGINATNSPAITSADYAHPSVYGAYLSALVIFQQVTGVDARTLGSAEKAAASLGITPAIAAQLQVIAYESVTNESATPVNQTVDPCTLAG